MDEEKKEEVISEVSASEPANEVGEVNGTAESSDEASA